jgi:putative transposase
MKLVRDCVPDRRKVAEFRLMALGEVLILPRKGGERRKTLREMARRKWVFPDGQLATIGVRTFQRWLSAAENARDRVAALMPADRADKGNMPCLSQQQQELLRRFWNERPESRWMNHYRDLRVESKETVPSYSSVKRFFRREGMFPKKKEGGKEKREKRSFEAMLVNQYWHLDAHHGSCRVIDEEGNWRVAKLIAFLDDKSRYCCHAQWYLHECCREMCSAFEQAALKCGLPFGAYTDNGAGMRGTEFAEGLQRLGVVLRYTGVECPYQNGKLVRQAKLGKGELACNGICA